MFTRAISATNWVNFIIYIKKNVLIAYNDYYPCTIQSKFDTGILCPEGNYLFIFPTTAPSLIPTCVPVVPPISAPSLLPSAAPTTPPTVSPSTLPSESHTWRPTYQRVFSTAILYDFVDSSDVEFESLELLNSLRVDFDNDGGDNETYYFNPGFRMEFISQIIINLNTQTVNLFEHDLNNVSMNITWLINNESNTTQALIADRHAILYNDKRLLVTDPDDDYSLGNYTIESYLVIYSSQSTNEYSQSICDTFDESVFESGNRYSIGIEIESTIKSSSIDLIANSPAVGGECIISPDYSGQALFNEVNGLVMTGMNWYDSDNNDLSALTYNFLKNSELFLLL